MACSIVQTLEPIYDSNTGKDRFKLTFAWTSHESDGSVSGISTDAGTFMTKTITEVLKGKILDMGKAIPGAATPSADYDVTVKDEDGVDLFSAAFTDCSATAVKTEYPYDGTNYGTRLITGALTPGVTNAGNSKTGSIVLHFS